MSRYPVSWVLFYESDGPASVWPRLPLAIAKEFVDADPLEPLPGPRGVMGDDQSDMAGLGDHRMMLVGTTLSCPIVRMGVYVGQYPKAVIGAMLPQRDKGIAMDDNDPRVKCGGIKVIVTNEFGDLVGAFFSQQEGACFAPALASAAQRGHQRGPDGPDDMESRILHSRMNVKANKESRDRG